MSAKLVGDTKIAHTLNYEQNSYSTSNYSYSKVLPQSGGQTAAVSSASGSQEFIFEIPSKPVNLSRSYLAWSRNFVATANINHFVPADTLGELQTVQLLTRGNVMLADLSNFANNYLQVVLKKELDLDEYLAHDPEAALYPNNLPANSGDAVRYDATAASRDGVENLHIKYSGINTALVQYKVLKLGHILNTLFAVDRTLLFPEIILLRVVFNGQKLCWTSTSNASPITAPAAAAAANTLTGITLYCANDNNPEVQQSLMAKLNSGGLSFAIPYVYTYQQNLAAATNQAMTVRLNAANGVALQKIILSIFNNVQAGSYTMFLHTNVGQVTLESFYTMLNNHRLTQYDLTSSRGEDYMLQRDELRNKPILNNNVYDYNWFWCDDFTKGASHQEVAGLPLTQEVKWDFFGTRAANMPASNYYAFAVVQKILTITSSMVSCQ